MLTHSVDAQIYNCIRDQACCKRMQLLARRANRLPPDNLAYEAYLGCMASSSYYADACLRWLQRSRRAFCASLSYDSLQALQPSWYGIPSESYTRCSGCIAATLIHFP